MRKIVILYVYFTFFLHHSASALISKKRATAQDSPFKSVFESYSKMWDEGKKAFKLYFDNSIDDSWSLAPLESGEYEYQQEEKKQKALFGYHLSIKYIYDNSNFQVNRPTLYFHGWKDTQGSGKILKKFCNILPGDLILFNFPDAFPLLCPFWKSSFGQKHDVLPALYTLNYVVTKKNLNAIDLFGASRGAATIINMIAVLCDNKLYNHYQKDLLKIGIDESNRFKLLQVIQNGYIVLAIPLRTMKETMLPVFAPQYLTRWHKHGLDPMQSSLLFDGLGLKILVHFQHKDAVVLNKSEAEYFKNLAQHNPDHTYLVMGDDGGHMNTWAALSKSVHTFKKIYGSSYDSHMDAKHDEVLEFNQSNQVIPNGKLVHFQNLELVESAIAEYHRNQK